MSNDDVIESNAAHVEAADSWNSEPFRLALEASPTAMLLIDQHGKIVFANLHAGELFGYARDELMGLSVERLVPVGNRDKHPDHRADFFRASHSRKMGAGRELYGLRKDGNEVPIEVGLNPLETRDGRFVLSSVIDITQRKRAEREREQLLGLLKRLNNDLEQRVEARTAELTAALKEREVLLQEVHHRVKNNLQVISSLINMQVRRLDDRASVEALRECQLRVQAIALIHEKLYQSKDYARVPLSDYVRSLAGSVFYATGTAASRVNLDFEVEELWLAVDKAIPCGLLLNELITNSLKHGFRDGRAGTIRVELQRRPGDLIRLAVCDNGIGLPSSFQLAHSDSLGLQLVSTLTEQLDGELAVHGDGGASFELLFKAA